MGVRVLYRKKEEKEKNGEKIAIDQTKGKKWQNQLNRFDKFFGSFLQSESKRHAAKDDFLIYYFHSNFTGAIWIKSNWKIQ